jgi:hypothetical protein
MGRRQHIALDAGVGQRVVQAKTLPAGLIRKHDPETTMPLGELLQPGDQLRYI